MSSDYCIGAKHGCAAGQGRGGTRKMYGLLVLLRLFRATEEGEDNGELAPGFAAVGIHAVSLGVGGEGVLVSALLKCQITLEHQRTVSLRLRGRRRGTGTRRSQRRLWGPTCPLS